MNNIKAKISNLVSALESYKVPFWALWQWAARFSSSSSPLRYTSQTGQEINNPSSDIDDETFDPAIKSMLTTAMDYYGGLFFPSQEPWSVVPSFTKNSLTPYEAEQATKRISAHLQDPRSKWYEAREVFLDNYIRFGTGDLFGVETLNPDAPFVVRSLGLWGMSVGRDLEEQHQVYNWTAQQIVDEFGLDKIKHRTDIVSAFEKYDVSQTYKVHHLVCRNIEYSDKAIVGKRNRRYVGYWFLDDNEPIETVYYHEKPFSINRYSIRAGKTYGYCPLTNDKKSFQSLEGTFFLAMSALGKIADRRMGYYDIGSIGVTELDSDSKYVPFNPGILGTGSAPIFPIEDSGDITGLWQAIRPEILNGLRAEYKLDAMAEYFAKGGNPRTATEILAIQNIKNKMIAPQVRRFAEQLIDFRNRITMIELRAMIKDGTITNQDTVDAINRGASDVFKIEETSVVKRIIYSERAEQFTSDLQLALGALQVQPSLATAIDLYQPLQNVLDYGNIQLRDKKEYEAKRDAVDMAALQTNQAGARAAVAQADKLEEEV